jgi:hypothetical protein
MALDASRILGSPQLGGVPVNRRGSLAAETMRNAGAGGALSGAVGAALQPTLERRAQGKAAETPAYKGTAFLAVSAGEVALIQLKAGLVSRKLDRLLARTDRATVAGAELGQGKPLAPLTITFADGSRWEFDVPLGSKGAAQQVAQLLSSPATAPAS